VRRNEHRRVEVMRLGKTLSQLSEVVVSSARVLRMEMVRSWIYFAGKTVRLRLAMGWRMESRMIQRCLA
jgi:hypothetical protein